MQGVQRSWRRRGLQWLQPVGRGSGGIGWAVGDRWTLQEQNQVILRAGIGGELLRKLSRKAIGILARAHKKAAQISRAMQFSRAESGVRRIMAGLVNNSITRV